VANKLKSSVYSLIKYLRMGDDIDIVYDEAAEKKLVMKIREGIVFMVIQHSQNTNIHSVCGIYRNNYVVFCYKCVDIIPEK
jgi:hypothetical protein